MFWPHYGKIKKKLKAKRTVETAVFFRKTLSAKRDYLLSSVQLVTGFITGNKKDWASFYHS